MLCVFSKHCFDYYVSDTRLEAIHNWRQFEMFAKFTILILVFHERNHTHQLIFNACSRCRLDRLLSIYLVLCYRMRERTWQNACVCLKKFSLLEWRKKLLLNQFCLEFGAAYECCLKNEHTLWPCLLLALLLLELFEFEFYKLQTKFEIWFWFGCFPSSLYKVFVYRHTMQRTYFVRSYCMVVVAKVTQPKIK